MVEFSPAMRDRLVANRPQPNVDQLPTRYERLTPAQRVSVREQYIENQHGLCYHCQESLEGPPSLDVLAQAIDWWRFPGGSAFLRHPVHLHHDHSTDMTIGAVHAYCNAVLFQYHGV
jgi:hypothetical protein